MFTRTDGKPLDGPDITRRFQRRLQEVGLPRMTYHDLRHSAASLLYAMEVDVKTAQIILGHSKASTTLDIYTKLDKKKGRLKEAMATMDATIGRRLAQ